MLSFFHFCGAIFQLLSSEGQGEAYRQSDDFMNTNQFEQVTAVSSSFRGEAAAKGTVKTVHTYVVAGPVSRVASKAQRRASVPSHPQGT